jgi:hypothetical protein
MASPIQSPAKCEVRSSYDFSTKREGRAEIHKQICSVYANVMNRQILTKWCCEFFEGRDGVHKEQRIDKSSLISDELLQEIEGEIRANRRMKIKSCITSFPKCLRSQFMKL